MTATQLRELVKGVVESHATHNTFYSIWSDVKDRETELTYPCAIWDQWRARLTEDEFGQLHRAILVRLLIVTVVATDRQPIARDTAVEAADNAAADYVLKIRQDYPDLVITNVSTTTQFDEYTQLETGVLLTMTVEGEGLCLDSDHFEPGIPGECVPGAVRNSDDTYTASVASGGTLTLPDVTHTDSDGSAVSTPAMVPFVATACVGALPATARLRQTGGAQIGGDYTIPAGGSLDITAPDGTVNTTDGLTPVGLVKSAGSANLPPSRISYKDAANADQVTGDINTGFVASRIQPAYQFPRRQLTVNGVGTGQYVTLPDLADGTIPNVVSPLKFGWSAGDADTLTWTVTSDEAGTYTTYTQDGASGTITYSKNGAGFAALSGSITLAVSDTIVVRRTITTNAGWSRWAP